MASSTELPSLIERPAGWSLEQPFYTSDAVYRRDLERVFYRHWLFAGFESHIPQPGDYFTFAIDQESIIVIRGRDERVHALFNVCRHRESRVCTEASGHALSLVCPYHQWVYGPDGTLLKARLMPAGFDGAAHFLARARTESLEGLIFVSLSPDPPDFAPFRSAIESRLAPYRIQETHVAHARQYHIAANWKLVVENSRECYHCGGGHPQYCQAVGFAAAIGSPETAAEDARIQEVREASLQAAGMVTEEIPFTDDSWFHYRRFFLRPGFVTESLDGRPVAPLLGTLPHWETGTAAVVTYPNLLLEANSDYIMTLGIVPAGPKVTRAEISWLVRAGAQEGVDYELARLTGFWRLTAEQDWKLCEDNQAGVNSMRYIPGPYAPHERGIEQFVQWYMRQYDRSGEAA